MNLCAHTHMHKDRYKDTHTHARAHIHMHILVPWSRSYTRVKGGFREDAGLIIPLLVRELWLSLSKCAHHVRQNTPPTATLDLLPGQVSTRKCGHQMHSVKLSAIAPVLTCYFHFIGCQAELLIAKADLGQSVLERCIINSWFRLKATYLQCKLLTYRIKLTAQNIISTYHWLWEMKKCKWKFFLVLRKVVILQIILDDLSTLARLFSCSTHHLLVCLFLWVLVFYFFTVLSFYISFQSYSSLTFPPYLPTSISFFFSSSLFLLLSSTTSCLSPFYPFFLFLCSNLF